MSRPPHSFLPLLLLTVLLLWAVGIRGWYASKDPAIGRFWDEIYSVGNIHAVVEKGSLEPVSYAYLRLSYLPQAAVLWVSEKAVHLFEPTFSWFEGATLKPKGFLVCRWVAILWGGLSILLTYCLGSRLFSPGVGILGAFFLAASPLHVHLSGMIKPEVLLLAAILAAFIWSLDAIERPTTSRYLLAGLGIGLALSSKQTGGLIAIPLTLCALYLGWRDRRHWRGLVFAGLTSVSVFLVLNPYVRYFYAFRTQRKFYRGQAVQRGSFEDPLEMARHFFSGAFVGTHGFWIGIAAMAGMVLLTLRLWKRRDESKQVGLVMLLCFPVGYVLVYGAIAQVVLGQNVLPLAPFTALAAAVFLLAVWQKGRSHFSWLGDWRIAAIAATAVAALGAQRVHGWVYETVVPTTTDLAIETLARELPFSSEQWVRWEAEGTPTMSTEGPPKHNPTLRLIASPDLSELMPRALDLSDAEVFPLANVDGSSSDFYRQRMEQARERRTRVVSGSPFRAWGPSLVLLKHPWRASGEEALSLASGTDYRFSKRENRVTIDIDGADRSFLKRNNRCETVTLPPGAELRLAYGLNTRRLRGPGLRRYTARFGVAVQPAAAAAAKGGEPVELFRGVLHSKRTADTVDEPARSTATIPLDRYAETRVRLCLTVEEVGADGQAIEGFAAWEEVTILDGDSREHAGFFRHGLSAATDRREIAALHFTLPDTGGVVAEPRVRVGKESMELTSSRHGQTTVWRTGRFRVNSEGNTDFQVWLPPEHEVDRLDVIVNRWTRGASRRD